jgi:hypothetical protein
MLYARMMVQVIINMSEEPNTSIFRSALMMEKQDSSNTHVTSTRIKAAKPKILFLLQFLSKQSEQGVSQAT